MEIAVALLCAFALGSIPTAYIAGKAVSGLDIRSVGSGNPGTMNAVQHLGKAVGLTVLAVDAGKGILAIVIAQQLSVTDTWVYLSAFAVTMGHNFTPALKFRGGKRRGDGARHLGVHALADNRLIGGVRPSDTRDRPASCAGGGGCLRRA